MESYLDKYTNKLCNTVKYLMKDSSSPEVDLDKVLNSFDSTTIENIQKEVLVAMAAMMDSAKADTSYYTENESTITYLGKRSIVNSVLLQYTEGPYLPLIATYMTRDNIVHLISEAIQNYNKISIKDISNASMLIVNIKPLNANFYRIDSSESIKVDIQFSIGVKTGTNDEECIELCKITETNYMRIGIQFDDVMILLNKVIKFLNSYVTEETKEMKADRCNGIAILEIGLVTAIKEDLKRYKDSIRDEYYDNGVLSDNLKHNGENFSIDIQSYNSISIHYKFSIYNDSKIDIHISSFNNEPIDLTIIPY